MTSGSHHVDVETDGRKLFGVAFDYSFLNKQPRFARFFSSLMLGAKQSLVDALAGSYSQISHRRGNPHRYYFCQKHLHYFCQKHSFYTCLSSALVSAGFSSSQ